MTGLIWVAAYLSVPVFALVREAIAAPLGWQDDNGFHYGRNPLSDSVSVPTHNGCNAA
jgi:hypothetical protein